MLTKPRRNLFISGIRPELPEIGKIKIGGKGPERTSKNGVKFQPPVKYDHIVITTLERGQDGNYVRDEELHKKFGEAPTEIPVRLMFDDIDLNLTAQLCAFEGKKVWCSGDGVKADRKDGKGGIIEVNCHCGNSDPDYEGPRKCKLNGSFQCIIEGAQKTGGVWRFRTTSYHSIMGIRSSLQFYAGVTQGHIAGIPFLLALRARDTEKGKVYALQLIYEGSIEDLMKRGMERAQLTAGYRQQLLQIEEGMKDVVSAEIPPDEVEDVAAEYYPEETLPEGVDLETGEVLPSIDDGVSEPEPEKEPTPPPQDKKPPQTKPIEVTNKKTNQKILF